MKYLVEKFVRERVAEHPHLEPWLGDYSTDFETQTLVGGLPTWSDFVDESGHKGHAMPWGLQTVRINGKRIPWDAQTEPHWNPNARMYPDEPNYWTHFGTSGWNWADKRSHWVGYDFDSIANHADGLDQDQLNEILSRAMELEYVTARTSKSGKGIHLMVYLDPMTTTRTHDEHAALAQHVISRMSKDTAFNFSDGLDCCGRILWHWAEGMTNEGCKRIFDVGCRQQLCVA